MTSARDHRITSEHLKRKAIVYIRTGDGVRAEAALEKGIRAQEKLMAVMPRHPYFVDNYRNLTLNLASAYYAQHRYREMAEVSKLLPKRDHNKMRGYLIAAENIALAIDLGVRGMDTADPPTEA